ncbi:N-acetyltransferase [Candidatus Margulisiibacteriota bacterium]
MIRKAKLKDAGMIAALIKVYADEQKMLHRKRKDVAENIRDYFVVDINKNIIGCVALHLYNENLSEIKALAVDKKFLKQDWGKRLIEKCLEEAINLEIPKIFALTYIPDFFKKYGFKKMDKAELPEKIWKECMECKKYNNCDEICMYYANRPNA